MPDHQSFLATILTPRLLHDVFDGYIPWPKEHELDFSAVIDRYYHGQIDIASFRATCYPALKELSAIPLDEIPDLLRFLPPPEDPTFPVQAIGLIVLLDQGTRLLLDGMDERWTLGFFDALALKATRRFVELPDNLRPDALHRWLEIGYTFSHWLVMNLWFLSPLAHSEDRSDHDILHRLILVIRSAVEERTHTTDPNVPSPVVEPIDLFQLLQTGPPRQDSGEITMHEWAYWVLAVYDGQPHVVRQFDGRFPFYNGALGRKDTEKEKEFLDSFNRMGCVSPEIEERIYEDVRTRRWTPLGG